MSDTTKSVLRRFLATSFTATEWDTKEEMDAYLREHKFADPSKHKVKSWHTKLRHKVFGPTDNEVERDYQERREELKRDVDDNNERVKRLDLERRKNKK